VERSGLVRRLSIPRPFSGGYKTDVPDYALALPDAAYAQDMVAPLGIARQRWGWQSVGPDFTGTVVSSARSTYAVPNTTVLTASRSDGEIRAASGASFVTLYPNIYSRSTVWLPRCVYNGEMIFCAQDGLSPLIRYAGVETYTDTQNNSVSMTLNAGSMMFTSGASLPAAKGSFLTIRPLNSSGGFSKNPSISTRIIETNGTTTFTVDSIRNKTTNNSTGNAVARVSPFGFAFPSVVVYEVGKVTSISGGTVNFEGTKLTDAVLFDDPPSPDALLVENTTVGNPHEICDITATNSDTQLTTSVGLSSFTNAAFKILRRCPFKDAAVHRGSLWGTGVKQYPNRVYVFIPTKDIGLPPAAEKPYDATLQAGYSSVNVQGFTRVSDYLAGAYDVPSQYDSTPVVAILSSPGPLLALKTDSVYGLYGTYDSTNPTSIEVTRISDGSGCIDLRSAITVESVPHWAGDDGIFSYRNGQIVNLTDGRIQREWQGLMSGYVAGTSWVATGMVGTSYLVVSCGGLDATKTGGAKNGPDTSNPTGRTLVYDLRLNIWLGRASNFNPVHMWSATDEDGGVALLAVNSGFNKVIDFAPALTGTSGTPADANSTYPSFTAWSSASLAQAEGVEGDTRFCDAVFHTNLYDSSSSITPSQFDISIVSGGSLDVSATDSKTLAPIAADTYDRVDRFKRMVNRTGRLHQIRMTMSSTNASSSKSDVPEIVMSFRDSRRGT